MRKKLLNILFAALMPLAGMNAQDMVLDSVVVTPVTCNGFLDGSITLYISDGIGDFRYTLLNSSYMLLESTVITSRSFTFSGYPEGSYWFFIDDIDGSTNISSSTSTSIQSPDPVQIQSVNTNDQTCSYLSNGTITVNATGEGDNLFYQLSGTVTVDNTDGLFTGLPVGTYNVDVTDLDGCPSSDNVSDIVIDSPPPITMTLDSNIPATCFGGADGSLSITPGGGTPSGSGTGYTYSWTGPDGFSSSNEDITDLKAGEYTVIVTDNNGCSETFGPITVGQASEITVPTINITDVDCNGGSNGAISITTAGGTPPYSYAWAGQVSGPVPGDLNPSGLLADTYNLTITDDAGCPKTFDGIAVVSEPDPITATVTSIINVSCFGGSNGSAAINVTGGTPNYNYVWTPASGPYSSNQKDPTNMPAGTYSLVITDANGCPQLFPDILVITEPEDITAVLDGFTDVTCFGGADGTAQVTVEKGTPGYVYLWTGTGTGHTSTDEDPADLIKDTYNLQITDANGCIKNFPGIVTIDQPSGISVVESITDIDCFGGNTGAIDITPSGGTAPYTFSWSGPDGFTSGNEDLSGIYAGAYNLIITDSQGCSETFGPITVGQASEIIVPTINITDVDCNGGSNGAISITTAGGTPPYSYAWAGQVSGPVPGDLNPSGLLADTYNLTITDDAGCPKTFDGIAVVSEPDPITATVTSIINVSCFGGSNGSAAINVTGGTPNYNYVWTPASGPYSSNQKDPTNMPAGTYSLEITDANGCPQLFPDILVITEPEDITAVLDGFTDVSCFGGADGTAQVTVEKGTPGYVYLWTGTGTGHTSADEDPADLIKDTYNLQITDANGCIKNFPGIVTIDQPSGISVVESITDIDCFGGNTGAINITPSGGTAPYTFSWSGPDGFTSGNEDLSGIYAGAYNLIITDSQGCFQEYSYTVNQNNSITGTFNITPLSCFEEGDGAIDVTLGGGTPPYTYSWTADNGYSNSTDLDIIGLDAGNYTLTVTDALNCEKTFPVQQVTEPLPLSASFIPTDALCYNADDGTINVTVTGGTPGYDYVWSSTGGFSSTDEDISGLAPDNYSLTVTDANGCFETYTDVVTIDEPAEISITADSTNITCNGYDDGTIVISTSGGTPGYSYSWTGPNGFTSEDQNLSSLEPGTYNLTVTDNNTCPKIFNNVATLTEPDAISVTFVSQTDLICNGESNGTIEIDVAGGEPPYAFSWTNSQGTVVSIDEDPTGLLADTYSLEVTDNGPCTVTYPDFVELTEPDELTTTLSKTDVLCAGESNGTITVTPSGGTPPYEHSRFPSGPYSADNTFTGLSSGTFRIYTRDAQSCLTSNTIKISKPEVINYEYGTSGQNICNGDSNAIITINNVTGGVQPYEFSIDGGVTFLTTSTFPNLPGGLYPVVVRDANLCEQAFAPLTILEPDSIIITYYAQTDVSTCYDAAEGSIIIMGNGGTGNIEYSLTGGIPRELGEFDSLLGGSYTVSLIDEQLCQKDTIVEILRPDQLVFEKADVTDVTGCPGDSNGEIDANVIGGTGVKEYSIDGSTWQSAGLFASLTAGDYTIMVRDANGCEEDTTVTVSEPLPISIISETATPASCFGTSTGSVAIEASGATPPYSYSLTPPVFQSTGTFSGLPAGDYTISVTDAIGCDTIISNTLTITEPPELIVDSARSEHITCNGFNDGKIDIYVVGGTSPYEYSIDNEATWEANSSFTGLGPGTYEVYARDVNGCSVFVGTFTINEPPVLSITAVVTDVTPCFGDTSGAISATASGGWNSYEYSIDGLNYQSSGDFTNLTAGDYTVHVRDSGNCSDTTDEIITEPELVTAVINKTDYVDDVLGTITISDVTGGTPPYEYSIDGATGTFTTNTSYTDLTAGFYDVVVRDANGCTFEESIQIFDIIPLTMVINHTDVICYGDDDGTIEFEPQDGVGTIHYSIDDGVTYTTEPLFENLKGDSTYLLQAYDEEAKQFSGSVYIAEPEELFVSTSIVPANCNTFSETGSADITVSGGTGVKSFNWSNGSTVEDLTNVESGQYNLTVTDEVGCISEESLFIPSLVTVNVNAGEDTTVCAGDTIALDGTQAADHTMLWEPQTYLSNENIPNPVAASITESVTYTYTLQETTSGFGCYNVDTLSIEVLPVYGLEITSDTLGLQETTIQLEVLNDGEYMSYEWIPETGLNMSTVADPVVTLQNTIRYWLYATNDFGCVETGSVLIEVIEDVEIYNAFSPNGDQINDYFEIENAYKFPEIIVEVYNRWGSRIFSSVGYSDEKRWDGTFNGKDAPTGTYYYVVIPHPEAKPITGNVTIIR